MFRENSLKENKVIVKVDNKEFRCDREKLALYSPYFHVMFNGSFVEKNKKEVNIRGVESSAFKNILNILDDPSYSVQYNEIFTTLEGACMLQFDNIRDYCISRLTDNLQLKYIFKIWNTAEKFDIHPLCEKAKCKAFLEFNKLKEKPSFLDIDIEQLHSYLSSSFLYCDNELDVFQAGMRWWYNLCEKFQHTEGFRETETSFLHTIISCVDFNAITKGDLMIILSSPDIPSNLTIYQILRAVLFIMENNEEVIPADIKLQAMELLNCKKRVNALLPCVVSSKRLPENLIKEPSVGCASVTHLNIQCFDEHRKCLRDLLDYHVHLKSRCISALKGYKILPYKENLLLLGGEYQYGTSDWNDRIWIYTLRDEWEILTEMPKERRHFAAYVFGDKLLVIGGTGKYRILLNDDMCYYDLRSGKWKCNISVPISLYDSNCCEYKNQLLMLTGNLENGHGFLYNFERDIWQKLSFFDPDGLVAKFPTQYILFAHNEKIYIKGSHLIEMELNGANLEIKSCEEVKPIHGDKVGFYQLKNKLYIFAKHSDLSEQIYTLHTYHIESKKLELLIQVNDPADNAWHISTGCFGFLHYSLTKDNTCISSFDKM